MTARKPLVVGADGLPQQLQPGDELAGAGAGLAELGADPDSPAPGSAWVLRTLENPAGTLQALVGGLPVVTTEDNNKYEISYRTAAGTTVRTLLT